MVITHTDARWSAFLARDAAARFIVAVKTTGIYCRPTCPARRPNRENVEFFETPLHASAAGYRACKRCRPDAASADAPLVGRLRSIVKAVGRVTESDLAAIGIDSSTARRTFQRATGQTFAGWQRAELAGAVELSLARFDSPLGELTAVAGDHALLLLTFADHEKATTSPDALVRRFASGHAVADRRRPKSRGGKGGVNAVERDHPILRQTRQQLTEYFAGTRRQFDVPLDPPDQAFARLAWEALLSIPYGETRTYAQQARAIGRPTACRAVARANGANFISIILPCHRIVGSNGTLTGYAGGLHRKQWLLDHERRFNQREE